MSEHISPDGKWKIILGDDEIRWIDLSNNLTETTVQFTIRELVEATKNIAPEIWKK